MSLREARSIGHQTVSVLDGGLQAAASASTFPEFQEATFTNVGGSALITITGPASGKPVNPYSLATPSAGAACQNTTGT